MPELPEVETVRSGLAGLLGGEAGLTRIRVRRRDLRFPVPATLARRLAGRPILAIRRRAKYLLWDCDRIGMLSHLGMTGSWRLREEGQELDGHDHLLLELGDGRCLVYRDPRRFGFVDLYDPADPDAHPRLAGLGPEPLGEAFTTAHLLARCRGRRVAIKQLLMDSRVVVGVGNIYAAEALFRARIRPDSPAGALSPRRVARLVAEIRTTLGAAIAAGGSSIRDFRDAGGSTGYFQHAFQVYGRAGEPCPVCGATLHHLVQGGRRTDWCGRCQR